MIKMSVVIPVHNRSELFEETLLSLEKQTSKDFEIIVTNDSNNEQDTKKIKETILNFKRCDIPIKYLFTEPNLGQSKNTNQGLKEAKGKYIRILHSDDLLRKDCIEKEITLFDEHEDIYIISHNMLRFVNKVIFDSVTPKMHILNIKNIWLDNLIFTQTIIPSCLSFRRELYDNTGGLYEKYDYLCDWKLFFDFLIYLYNNQISTDLINFEEGYVAWRHHDNNLSDKLIFHHFYEHEDIIKYMYNTYTKFNLLSSDKLFDNIYKAIIYRFSKLKTDINLNKKNRKYLLKYFSICFSRKYTYIRLLFIILLLPVKLVKKIIEFFNHADIYRDRLTKSVMILLMKIQTRPDQTRPDQTRPD
ncbi:glycosyltransferase family 2 protein, partial [Brachyspira intermedia]|uniref:glycosyltransferase family 2 protein n=1 Tax=Brachyspira intermedia TaxID=84377 RepID=UPI0030076BF0